MEWLILGTLIDINICKMLHKARIITRTSSGGGNFHNSWFCQCASDINLSTEVSLYNICLESHQGKNLVILRRIISV